jgi:hypothetical protein
MPKVSVIMPVYNGASFIAKAIDSILCQTFHDLELIIVDDASTDDTEKIISAYDDARVRLVRNQSNLGIATSRNRGIAFASGDYIALLDADDIALPTRLSEQVGFLEDNPEYGMVGSWIEFIDKAGNSNGGGMRYEATPDEIPILLLFNNCFAQSTVTIRRTILPVGPYKMMAQAEDYDLWTQLVKKAKVWNLQKVLVQYRMHDSNVSLSRLEEQEACTVNVIRQYLKELQIVPTEREIKVHRLIASMQFEPSLDILAEIETWLLKLTMAHKAGTRFVAADFKRLIGAFWYSSCRNSVDLGDAAWNAYWASDLSKLTRIRWTRKIRFWTLSKMKSNKAKISG